MSGWRRRLALALAIAALLGADADPEDPPLCRDVLAAYPGAGALETLAKEESRLAREARLARREARKLMRGTLGASTSAGGRLPGYEALLDRERAAKHDAKVICYCRARRADPHREDCELLYPVVIR